MLSRKRRLTREQIKVVLKKGKVFNSSAISLKILFIPKKLSAFAVVVSSKIVKKAVKRNQLKRRVKYIIFKLLPFLKEGFLTLLFFKKEGVNFKLKELEKEVKNLYLKAKII